MPAPYPSRLFETNRRRVAFTLIELMIVVAIIALLISVLLPSLAAAREQARIVKCSAQLRQIGTAAQFYVVDNAGWLPGDYWPSEHDGAGVATPHVLFAEVLQAYLGGVKYVGATQGIRDRSRDCILAQRFASMPVLQCPSWPGGVDGDPNSCPMTGTGTRRRSQSATASSGRSITSIDRQVLTYAINGWDFVTEKQHRGTDGYSTLDDGPGSRGLVKLEVVPRPTETLFITEANRDNIGWQSFGWHDIFAKAHLWDGIDARMIDDMRHASGKGTTLDRAKTNTLHYDGHVATVRLVNISAHDFSPYQRPSGTTSSAGRTRR